MTTSPVLGVPLIATQQQQPNVTHNEAVVLLQSLLYGVKTRGGNTPPALPAVGETHIAGAAPTGAWAGRDNCIAVYTSGGWRFIPFNDDDGTPIAMGGEQEGLRVYSNADSAVVVWDGSAWGVL